MKLLTLKFLLFIIYLLSTVISYAADKPNIRNLVVHKKNIKLKNIKFEKSSEEVINLNDFRGKLVIINFWATWCIPCRDEMPLLDELQGLSEFNNLKIFPINVGKEKIKKIEKFFSELKIKNLELYFDNSSNLANSFLLRGIPTSVFVNKKGEEFARILGYVNFKDEKLIKWLAQYN